MIDPSAGALPFAPRGARREFAIPDAEQIVCGMSLGHAREDIVDHLLTVREPTS